MSDDPRYLDARGWALSVARLRLDLYRVVAAILASEGYDLQRMAAGHQAWPLEIEFPAGDALERLATDFQTGEIEHGLISVAAMTRVILDQMSPRPPEARLPCGTMTTDSQSQKKPLSLREACNKILHATTRSFVSDDGPGLIALMRLTGTQFEKAWVAEVHVLLFATHVATLTDRERTLPSGQ